MISTTGTVRVSRQLLVLAYRDKRDDLEMYDELLTVCERQAAEEGRPLVKL